MKIISHYESCINLGVFLSARKSFYANKNPLHELKFTSFILKLLFLLLGKKNFDEKIYLNLSAVMPKEFFLLFDELGDQYLVLLAHPWAQAS